MTSLIPLLKDLVPMLMPSHVHITKARDLDPSTGGETEGMIRKGAIVGKSEKICASLMIAKPHTSSTVHHHADQETIIYALSGHGCLITLTPSSSTSPPTPSTTSQLQTPYLETPQAQAQAQAQTPQLEPPSIPSPPIQIRDNTLPNINMMPTNLGPDANTNDTVYQNTAPDPGIDNIANTSMRLNDQNTLNEVEPMPDRDPYQQNLNPSASASANSHTNPNFPPSADLNNHSAIPPNENNTPPPTYQTPHYSSSSSSSHAQTSSSNNPSNLPTHRHPLSPGDFALIPAWTEHQEVNDSDEDVTWVIVRTGREPVVVNLSGWGGGVVD